jgi:hypothetical protein
MMPRLILTAAVVVLLTGPAGAAVSAPPAAEPRDEVRTALVALLRDRYQQVTQTEEQLRRRRAVLAAEEWTCTARYRLAVTICEDDARVCCMSECDKILHRLMRDEELAGWRKCLAEGYWVDCQRSRLSRQAEVLEACLREPGRAPALLIELEEPIDERWHRLNLEWLFRRYTFEQNFVRLYAAQRIVEDNVRAGSGVSELDKATCKHQLRLAEIEFLAAEAALEAVIRERRRR